MVLTPITQTILTNIIDFLAPLLGLGLVIYCIVIGWGIFKGNEGSSFKKLLTGIGLFLLLLGVMFAAGSFSRYGEKLQGITEKVIDNGVDDAENMVG